MRQAAQQMSLISNIAEQPAEWVRLVVPDEQIPYLHSGGANYIAEFITQSEESDLLAAIDALPWKTDLKRRVQHYGYHYDYTERNINASNWLGELPGWTTKVSERLVREKIFKSPPDQLIVNEYEPKQGIAPHTDRDCFGPVIASLSLGSDCMMRIMPDTKSTQDSFDIVLQRRSLVVFQGKSRNAWRHSIAPRKSDKQGNHSIPRQRRVSLTFRTVKNQTVGS